MHRRLFTGVGFCGVIGAKTGGRSMELLWVVS